MPNKVDIDKNIKKQEEKFSKKKEEILNEYEKFSIKGNAIDMAVGIAIGSAFTQIVNSIVSSIISLLFHLLQITLIYINYL